MASYQYLRDIAPEDLQNEPPRTYTRRQKAANWWSYHWKLVVIGALAALCVLMFLSDVAARPPESDYTITVVGPGALPQELCTALEQALAPYAADRNGDGETVLTVQSVALDYGPVTGGGLAEYEAVERISADTRLAADLESGTTGIFLLAQPQQFQSATAALVYTDGTDPGLDADMGAEWPRMVYRWADCPVLAQLELPGEQGEAWQDELAGYYIGRRGVWTEKQAEALEGMESLWTALTQGARPIEY